ncbi:hypothetical protein GY12_12405 [Micrococcus luteus]|nr:hypothetical protein GY12_12405 [Micrococcus luteus]
MLFLDEPTAGLDPETRPVVHDVVREQTDRGAAVLLTTHLLDDAERLADDVAILRAGRVVRSGSLAELTRVAEGDVVDVDFGDASPRGRPRLGRHPCPRRCARPASASPPACVWPASAARTTWPSSRRAGGSTP